VVDAVIIRPLPYADSDRLVMVWEDASNIAYSRGTPAPGTWQEWRRGNSVFTDIAATRTALTTLSGDGEPEQLQGRRVTANFWSVLGSQPARWEECSRKTRTERAEGAEGAEAKQTPHEPRETAAPELAEYALLGVEQNTPRCSGASRLDDGTNFLAPREPSTIVAPPRLAKPLRSRIA
jgi:hypothetical protein